ncbi:hypothetical protein HRR83_004549 [Exophiala dermatitidis]|uniref:Peroxisomal membrane protein 4 n=2 Tax=Exophiala dermatitidis TaxID=5970 RepID=H6BR47_EXODN|nr:uncharacterized protein HMPREF1120_02087 [Exophiala dermatitidis NIH/UT8656]KAJ4519426.1 hypothetical protein HRR74_004169 [Exophiala dermatitidis]EHY53907.1 hypothetical protein HMPREF1120_02087 [Exophiala dermatitidis NIH/UT8656]KAJ4529242.1 hypothetical protein HRR73_000264 [Exophiala dermatitidis]KAJ4544107.1 hypothetical protein HRR76_002177 [Exophiala dermatitidis]KAJ4549286.1 hypothetical protein HRR77_004157 [Exophiala dermatitidis]
MDVLKESVESVILNPDLAPLLAIVKAARNGAVYGAKVRFPHALVMVFLFRKGSFREKIRLVLKATKQHARNLATFAAIYKTAMLVLRLLNPVHPGKEGPYDTFFAGLLGGYAVFGRAKPGSVNQQIVIYVFARVILALARLSIEPPSMTSSTPTPTLWTQRLPPSTREKIRQNAWPVFASLSWAMVMYIFRWQPESIQSSLRSSMKYIYVNSDYWDSFKNFLIHNT